jgi:transcriptional regulator with XRE-family HTH domain
MQTAYRPAPRRAYCPPVPNKVWNELVAKRVASLVAALDGTPDELKQETIMKALEVSQPTVSRLLNGEQQLTADYLVAFGRLLGVEPGQFLPSLSEIESGTLEARQIPRMRVMAEDALKPLPAVLAKYLESHFQWTTPQEYELLQRSRPVPAEGEDPEKFYGDIIETIRRRPPR